MLVQLPEEQTQEIQQMIATLIKNEIHHFKEVEYANTALAAKEIAKLMIIQLLPLLRLTQQNCMD